jgi:hypothetical protein
MIDTLVPPYIRSDLASMKNNVSFFLSSRTESQNSSKTIKIKKGGRNKCIWHYDQESPTKKNQERIWIMLEFSSVGQ